MTWFLSLRFCMVQYVVTVERRIIEVSLMKAKKNAPLVEEQVGVVEIPYRMFNMVVREQRTMNRIIVGDCCGECFWYIRENGMIKSRRRHEREKVEMETLLVLQNLFL